VKALDIGVEIGPMWGDNVGHHAHTPEEAHQRGREIPSRSASDKAWVIVKGEYGRQTMLTQKLGHHLQQGFGIKLGSDLPVQPDGGPSIDKVGDLHDMLPFALRISRHTAGIFEIELDFLPWLPRFQWFGLAATILFNAAELAQDFPDRRLGAWQAQTGSFERRIAVQIIQNGFWPRDALQVLWGVGTDFKDALHDLRL
jgi:hypothetical protein